MKQQLHFFWSDRNYFCIKSVIYITLSLLFSLYGKSQSLKDKFQIHGSIDIKQGDMIYLNYYSNLKEKGVNDSCKIQDGYFFFKGMISEPAVAFIKLSRDKNIDDKTAIMFIEPTNMKVKLCSNPFTVMMLSGSKTHIDFNSLNFKRKILNLKHKKIIEDFEKEKEYQKQDDLKINIDSLYAEIKQLEINFFATHPQSFVTGYLLQSYYRKLPPDSLQMYYNNMNEKLRKSIYGVQLKDQIYIKRSTMPAQKAPDFKTVTLDNKLIKLTDFEGRYVILDFWAHWCVPCRKSFPHLIGLFNKYHNKGLDIIGVADDDFMQDAWKKAIENDKVGIWYHILRGIKKNKVEEVDKTESINDAFNVNILPTKILIDQKGIIIGRYEGTEADHKLEKILQEIFK